MEGVISQGPLFIACLVFLMGIVIVVHELGHYLAGRVFGVAVESFSVGFGKPMFERRDRNGTRWRVNWIPLGGFVAFIDKQTAEAGAEDPDAPKGVPFDDVSPLKKIVISLAGPIANFVLAAVIFSVSIGVHGIVVQSIKVASTIPDMPAERAGILANDQILAVNGKTIRNSADVTVAVMLSPNTPLDLLLNRDGSELTVTVTPQEIVRENDFGQMMPQSTLGIQMYPSETFDRLRFGPVESVVAGVQETGATIERTVVI